MAVSAALAACLLVAYSALRRAERAREDYLDWELVDRLTREQGYEKTAALLDKRLAAHPNDSMLHYFKARVYYTAGRGQQALEEADRAIKLGYAQEISHLLKGLIYGRLYGDYAREKELASKALTYDPAFDEGFIIRAEAEFVLREFKACAADAASYSSLRPEDTWGYETAMLCLDGLKDYAGAEKAALKVLKLKPRSHAAYWRLGLVHAGQGLHRKAINDYSEAIRLSGGRPQYFLSRARSCEALGDLSCSAWDYYSAMDWKEISDYASYYYLLGSGMHRIDELKYALDAADKAVKMDPANADYYELRGRIEADAGKTAAARKDFLKVSALAPSRKPAADLLLEELEKK